MREKVIIFLVGLFLGSIISTSSIYVYSLVNSNDNQVRNDDRDFMNDGMRDVPIEKRDF